MADVRDILELEPASAPEVTRDSFMGTDKHKKRFFNPPQKLSKRPEGMHREVFALLYNDPKDGPPLYPSDTSNGYKQTKVQLGMRKVRKWEWKAFTNPGRTDNAEFKHWRRVSDEPQEYPFAKFNKKLDVIEYSDMEYNEYLSVEDWTKEETDHLLDLSRRFDLRFIIMADRYDVEKFKKRSVEDLKERYYKMAGILAKLQNKKVYTYDAEHERRRKEQLKRLYERTTEQMEEEQTLVGEMKKIEVRKKERERKTQDLQKLISQADSQSEAPRKTDKKLPKKKISNPTRPSKVDNTIITKQFLQSPEATGIKFPDFKNSGVSLRSQRMKLPANVGQKKSKCIEQLLQEMEMELNPIATEETSHSFNDLRSDMVLVMELKAAVGTCEFELQALRHQYEVLAPGKTLTIPPQLLPSGDRDSDGIKTVSGEIIDVVGGSPGTPNP